MFIEVEWFNEIFDYLWVEYIFVDVVDGVGVFGDVLYGFDLVVVCFGWVVFGEYMYEGEGGQYYFGDD